VLFNSYGFLLAFLPLALVGFFAFARLGRVAAACWLIGASLVFYGWWHPPGVALLALSIGGNYALSRALCATARRPTLQGWILVGGITANLTALGYYKYLAAMLGFLRGHGIVDIDFSDPLLPLGISFFTFTQIGFLLDCRNGVARDRSLLNYVLFVAFFPHLIAGPILHNREIMPQFADAATYRYSAHNLAAGLGIFLLGLLKKCLLADPTSAGVAAGFAHAATLPLFDAWQVALCYSLQLYFDFSGYSDMAIGLARMFNLRFPLNFNSPYKAHNIIDYWQRWHMTLTRYITLYIYNPLALAIVRRRAARGLPTGRDARARPSGFATMVVVPLFITMTLAGIWHGAGLQFLVFGLLHGLYLSLNHAWRLLRPHRGPAPAGVAAIPCVLLTYLCVLVGSVFFRAPSIGGAVDLLAAMVGWHGLGDVLPALDARSLARSSALLGWMLALYGIVWLAPNSQQIMRACEPAIGRVQAGPLPWLQWQSNLPWALAFGIAATLGILSIGGTGEFLYFQF
jgi:alginate O-acetyltransferase complex protein AlgI